MRLRGEQTTEQQRQVERETVVEASPEEVWEALTDDERRSEWMDTDREIDPVEVVEPERFSYTWTRPGEDPSLVEFDLEAVPGGTRVRVVETGTGPAASVGGWAPRLIRLRRSLSLVLA